MLLLQLLIFYGGVFSRCINLVGVTMNLIDKLEKKEFRNEKTSLPTVYMHDARKAISSVREELMKEAVRIQTSEGCEYFVPLEKINSVLGEKI